MASASRPCTPQMILESMTHRLRNVGKEHKTMVSYGIYLWYQVVEMAFICSTLWQYVWHMLFFKHSTYGILLHMWLHETNHWSHFIGNGHTEGPVAWRYATRTAPWNFSGSTVSPLMSRSTLSRTEYRYLTWTTRVLKQSTENGVGSVWVHADLVALSNELELLIWHGFARV